MPTRNPSEPGSRGQREQALSETEPLEAGVYRDHVYLPHTWFGLVVDLGPATGGESPVAFMEQESGWVEPRLALSLADRVEVPTPLFGMGRECTIVDHEPRGLVHARLERPRRDLGVFAWHRKRTAHLVQIPALRETTLGRHLVRQVSRFGHPEVHVAPALSCDLAQGRGKQVVSYVVGL